VTETGDLKDRVETAIQQLAASHEQRREHNQSLTRMLANLETKYGARNEELRHCRARIRALNAANEQLVGLVERLVGIVETQVKSDPDEAVRRAAAMAHDMLRSWPEDAGTAAEVGPPQERPALRFEDVSEAELAAELAAEEPLPEPEAAVAEPAEIIDAAAAGDTPAFEEFDVVDRAPADDIAFEPAARAPARPSPGQALNGAEAVEIDIPEPAAPAGPPVRQERETTRDDIRAMLDRLERAAARAQTLVDQEAGKNGRNGPLGKQRSA
jgi:ABC-type transporter Mla subunit MlaD